METRTISSDGLSGSRRSGPSNVIPFLAARSRVGCSPLELAAVLRRLHRARLRGGFVVLAPVSLDSSAGIPEKDPKWWSQLCDRIREQTRFRVALMEASTGAGEASAIAQEAVRRAIALGEVGPGERAALIELARGVCTTDAELLAEAREMDVSAPSPDQVDRALRNGTLSALFAHPITVTLPISA